MPHNVGVDRRRRRRAYLPIAASLFTEDAKAGEYLVRDISAGGALFTNGPSIPRDTLLRAVLVGRGVEGLSLRGVVKRCESGPNGASSVAVEFQALPSKLEDVLQNLVLRALDHEHEPTVLVVHPKPLVLAALAADIAALGMRVVLAMTSLTTIRWLCDLETIIQTVLVDQSHDPDFGRQILSLAREEFPGIRRVALCEGTTKDEIVRTLANAEVDEVLDVPWTPSGLKVTLDQKSLRADRREALSSPP